MSRTRTVGLATLAALSVAAVSQGALLWDQGMGTGTIKGAYGNATSSQNFADLATFGSSVTITGYNHFTTDSSATPSTMTVRVYAGGATPGALITSQVASVSSIASLGAFGVYDVYEWSLDLAPINLAAGSYWFGASYDAASGGGQVTLNGVASPGDGQLAKFSGAAFSNMQPDGDQAFQLTGAPVPEPFTLSLAGLALVAALRRRMHA